MDCGFFILLQAHKNNNEAMLENVSFFYEKTHSK
jgi:hypothetical protein